MSTRTTLTNSIRPLRYLFATLAIFSFSSLLQEGEYGGYSMGSFLIFLLLTVALYHMRAVSFDSTHLYRQYGRSFHATPFTEIVSIKRSRIKLNGTRMWKVTYLNDKQQEATFRFKEGLFQHGSTQEFISKVKAIKPDVLIWQHPFFGNPG